MQRVSSYADSLTCEALKRYKDKISVLNYLDPFAHSLGKPTDDIIPPVEASDIVSYLVLQSSFVTTKQFKARKSLEAYKQFVCGWCKDVKTWKVEGVYLTTARVRIYSTVGKWYRPDCRLLPDFKRTSKGKNKHV